MQRVQDDEGWVVIGDAPDRPGSAFQYTPDLRPPQWPDPDHPQQMHLDVTVGDLEQAEKAIALGAQRLPAALSTSGYTATHPATRSACAHNVPHPWSAVPAACPIGQ